MKYIKTNKIIAFILSMVMILTNILPNISSDAFGIAFSHTNTKAVEPVVEYSDSGQKEPEIENTGTDLDNFKFYLDYGTVDSKISGDTLFVKDQSNKINATLRVEYTGDQVYDAGDLSMTFNYPTGIYRYRPDYDMLSDVGAELKGSGSGRGDWYYEKKLGQLTFTNKNATTGSFTSSIEIILDMPDIRYVINDFNSTMNASFSVNGLDSVLNSKTLFFSTETTHDEISLIDIKAYTERYNTYSTDSSTYTYGGYKLNDYYIMRLDFNSKLDFINRGFDMKDTVTLPEGCFFINSGKNTYSDSRKITEANDKDKIYSYSIAVSKSAYTAGDEITISWNKKAIFFDTNETWEDSLEEKICILDNAINVIKVNANVNIFKSASISTIYTDDLEEDEGVDFYWIMRLYSNSGYNIDNETFAPTKTIIEDKNTFVSNSAATNINKKSRDLEEDEYYLTYIEFVPEYQDIINKCNIEIYAKRDADTEYTLVKNFEYQNENLKIDLDTLQRYTDFKIIINGNWINNKGTTNPSMYINVGAHINLIKYENYLCNEVHYEETLNNGEHKTYPTNNTSHTFAYINMLQSSSIVRSEVKRTSNASFSDNKIAYKPVFSGYYILGCSDKRANNIKIHKFTFDIDIPSYINFEEITNDNLRIYGKIYSEKDNSLISNEVTSNYFDIDVKTLYENNSKKLSVKVNVKDGYYVKYLGSTGYYYKGQSFPKTTCNFEFNPTLYIDYDAYNMLMNMGKLPSTFKASITNYPSEELILSGISFDNKEHSSTLTLSIPSLAGSTYQGVEKFVNTGSGFTKDLSGTMPGEDYSYKLRIAGGETLLDSIILYDNLEEAYGDNEYWKGTFNGLDTTLLDMIYEGADYTYTVYYSKDKNQTLDLSAAGWVRKADWTDNLADVKSIAIDLGDLQLKPKSLAYVIVNMKAPEDGTPSLKAYNSYFADYKAYDSTTGIQMEDIEVLPSNTTEVIYNKNITYTVNKVWDGEPGDSAEVKFLANGKEKETITLNADNNWTHTFTELPVLDDRFSPIEYSVEETAIYRYETSYQTSTDKDGNITTDITNKKLPDDVYTFTKKWETEGITAPILGFIDSTLLSKDEQKEVRVGKTFNITASGASLEDVTFSATADENGLITILDEYAEYSNFSFQIKSKQGKLYACKFETKKGTPTIPDEITLKASEIGKDKDGNKTDEIIITKDNNWTTSYSFDKENISFEEKSVDGWEISSKGKGLAITFDDKFKTEKVNYDYLIIYYVLDGQTYQFGKYGGTSLAGQTINVPSTDVYFYWHTDSSSCSYYGFKVTDIKTVNVDSSIGTKATLPNYSIEELEKGNYPDSAFGSYTHGNYGNNVNKIWHCSLPSNIDITKVEDNKYNVEVVNTGKMVSNVISSEIEKVPDIYTITKEWNINSDKIKISVKTKNGYDAEYDYIDLLDEKGSVLERIYFEKLGLAVSRYEYDVDKTYTAKVHMQDDSVYETPVNVNKFNITPVEFDLYVENELVDTFILNEENDWNYTTVPSDKLQTDEGIALYSNENDNLPHSVEEKTKGNWRSEITYTEYDNHIDYTIINNVDFKIEISTITVSDPEPPVETGNNNYLLFYLFALGIGFIGIIIAKKKKA